MEWERAVGLVGEAFIFLLVIVWGFFQLRELKKLRLEREAKEREEAARQEVGPSDN